VFEPESNLAQAEASVKGGIVRPTVRSVLTKNTKYSTIILESRVSLADTSLWLSTRYRRLQGLLHRGVF